jgi:hypothetical protein
MDYVSLFLTLFSATVKGAKEQRDTMLDEDQRDIV